MKVLVLGSGGREHTIVWKLFQSRDIKKLYCCPGNGGISEIAHCEDIKVTEFGKLYDFIKQERIDIVVVGPEQPSVDGVKDFLSSKGIDVFSPTQLQAKLEGSKIFAKLFMKKYNIPTAEFVIAENYEEGIEKSKEMFNSFPEGIVVKADGLCAGKGAVVCDTLDESQQVLYEMMVKKKFGPAGEKVVIEKKLKGIEISVIAFCDGKTILPLTHSQDHKQIYDNDQGPNTGGMGAYSPVPFLNKRLEEKIYNEIILRFLSGLEKDGIGYNGAIYFGLMIENLGKDNQQPYVLEFNCRFGDPETQVVLPLVKNDLLEIICKVLEQKLSEVKLEFLNKFTVCVVLASKGYPEEYDVGKEIFGLENFTNREDILIFHAGTKKKDNRYYSSGGRVLGVVGLGDSLKTAIETSYSGVEKIRFENVYYRRDIGQKGLRSY